jgi:hypothetical protein
VTRRHSWKRVIVYSQYRNDAFLLNNPTPSEQVDNERNHRDYQQQVNQPACDVKSHPTQEPGSEQDEK